MTDINPADHVMDGQSFYAAHLTGSGTLQADGSYGPPTPDPTILRGGPKGAQRTSGGVERGQGAAPLQAQSTEDAEPAPKQRTAKR
ncbi:MAG TPA: hypothetical protein VFU47_12890 [Armatimonadota bacterium]|nr:hypothetical protein [Armatimonadota bacterium]